MGLMDRVLALVRANLKELLAKSDHPEKLAGQLILDMENQLIQVKTQAAIAIADQHMLEQRMNENEEVAKEWMRKAELAVERGQDDLARKALERRQNYRRMAVSFEEQVVDRLVEVEELKAALRNLEAKIAEAKAEREMLIAQQRRLRAASKSRDARKPGAAERPEEIARLKREAGIEAAAASLPEPEPSLEEQFAALERDREVERLLAEIKAKRGGTL
jgi:phage shock protein A